MKQPYFRLVLFLLFAGFVWTAFRPVWRDYQQQEITQLWLVLAVATTVVYAALGIAIGVVVRRFPYYKLSVPVFFLWFLPAGAMAVAGLAYGWPYTEAPLMLYVCLPYAYWMWFEGEAKQIE